MSLSDKFRENHSDQFAKLQECIDEAVAEIEAMDLPVICEMMEKFGKPDLDKIINMTYRNVPEL